MYSLRIKSPILFERAAIASLANDDAGFLRSNRARRASESPGGLWGEAGCEPAPEESILKRALEMLILRLTRTLSVLTVRAAGITEVRGNLAFPRWDQRSLSRLRT